MELSFANCFAILKLALVLLHLAIGEFVCDHRHFIDQPGIDAEYSSLILGISVHAIDKFHGFCFTQHCYMQGRMSRHS